MLAAILCCFFYGSTVGRDSIPVVNADANGDGGVDSPVKPLSVGDEVPDIPFEMINYPQSTAKLSDFRGKLVILDFWGTFCTSCIATFPEEMELKKQFGDKVEILLVNSYEKKEKVEEFVKSFEEKKGIRLTLPMVVRDSMARGLFPHESVPHCVWINGNGEVIAITSSGEVDSMHIDAALEDKKLDWLVKDDKTIGDYTKPYLMAGDDKTEGGLVEDKVAVRLYNLDGYTKFIPISIFTKRLKMDIAVDGSVSNADHEMIGRRMINQPLWRFFQYCYDVDVPAKRWVIEGDSAFFFHRNGVRPVYCFELVAQAGMKVRAVKDLIKLDLYKAFGLVGDTEKRSVYRYEIVPMSSGYVRSTVEEGEMKEITLGELVERLNEESDNYLLSESQKSALLKIDSKILNSSFKLGLDAVERVLQENGYSLKSKQCEMTFFVIREPK